MTLARRDLNLKFRFESRAIKYIFQWAFRMNEREKIYINIFSESATHSKSIKYLSGKHLPPRLPVLNLSFVRAARKTALKGV